MTTGRRDGQGTPFGHWLRAHPDLDATTHDLSATDCDMWIHKYRARDEHSGGKVAVDHVMLVEIKCFLCDVPYAQRDTLAVIDDMLRLVSVRRGRRFPVRIPDRRHGRPGVMRQARWLGVHVLQLSGDRPDNSECILWDGRYIDEEMLLALCRFDLDPDSPTRKFDTRRHHRRPFSETHPGLPLQ